MEKNLRASEYFRMMNMIYAFQAFGLLAFSIVIFYIYDQQPDKGSSEAIEYTLIGAALAALAASRFVPRMMLRKIDPNLEFRYKVPKYFAVAVVRAACLEASGLMACITAFLTGHLYFLLIVPLLLLVLFFYRPTRPMVATELNLSVKERELLDNPETVLVLKGKGL